MADKQVHKDALPNWEKAVIPPEKLRDYSLNPDHSTGGGDKARVFKSMLGLERQDWESLATDIRARLPEYPAFRKGTTVCGEPRWTVYIPVVGANGNLAVVTTGWVFKLAEPDVPVLVTCYIETQEQEKLKSLLGLEP